ncbi:MAG: glycerophosphodiester phosphodiesterase family protein [Marmoricola sp.]
MSGPIVIAHRGASGHRPEHTAGAYRLAFRLGADSVELDLLPTLDGVLVCRHDLELSRTTDVAVRPELTHLRRTVEIEGRVVTGWFVYDFTVVQLRTLRCRERWPRKRPTSASYDGQYPVLTLQDLLALVDGESARLGRPLRVHAEIKHPAFLESVGQCLPDLVEEVRRPKLSWLSFDPVVLRRLRMRGHNDLVQLFEGRPRSRELSMVADYATGIGVRRKTVLPRDRGRLGKPSKLVAKAHRRGLDVLVWTHRAENEHLPKSLRVGAEAHGHGRAQDEAGLLFAAGIDGLVSDFPDLAVAALTGQRTGAGSGTPIPASTSRARSG